MALGPSFLHFIGHKYTKKNDEFSVNSNGQITTVDGVPVRKVFVANIPYADEKGLKLVFSQFGNVREASIVTPKDKPPFGFVMFGTPEEATRCLTCRSRVYLGPKRLYISPADSWHQPLQLPDGTIIWDRRKALAEEMAIDTAPEDGDDEEENVQSVDLSLNSEDSIVNEKDCPISKLNDDCLLYIFNLIRLHNRLELHKVCRRWNALSMGMWRKVKKLDFSNEDFIVPEDYLTDFTLKRYLILCPNILSLNIAIHRHRLSSNAIITIAKTCKYLEEIKIRDLKIKKRSLAFLARSCSRLKSFHVDTCEKHFDTEMLALVKTCRKLEAISLKFCPTPSGNWLRYLRSPLRSLCLGIYEFNPQFLLQGLSNVKTTLRELTLISCDSIQTSDVERIANLLPDLESLTLHSLQDFQTRTVSSVARLSKLVTLNLQESLYVTDDFLFELTQNCTSLQNICFTRICDSNLTSKGLLLLGKLTELISLKLDFISKVNDSVLKSLSSKLKNLKYLSIYGCNLVTDEGFLSVVVNCKELVVIDVGGCDLLTNNAIDAAAKIISTSPNGSTRKLRIFAGDTKIDVESVWPDSVIVENSNEVDQYPGAMFILHPEFLIDNDPFFNNLFLEYCYDVNGSSDEFYEQSLSDVSFDSEDRQYVWHSSAYSDCLDPEDFSDFDYSD